MEKNSKFSDVTSSGDAVASNYEMETPLSKRDDTGVVYISRIPPYMGVHKLRTYMEQFGEVRRIYMTPEDPADQKFRKKLKGCKKPKYIDGWVEFGAKKIARAVAESLNAQPVGGRKRKNFWREDLWNIKYLKNFKWHHLSEQAIYQKNVRAARLDAKLSSVQKTVNFYLEQAEKRKDRLQILQRQMKKREKQGGLEGVDQTYKERRKFDKDDVKMEENGVAKQLQKEASKRKAPALSSSDEKIEEGSEKKLKKRTLAILGSEGDDFAHPTAVNTASSSTGRDNTSQENPGLRSVKSKGGVKIRVEEQGMKGGDTRTQQRDKKVDTGEFIRGGKLHNGKLPTQGSKEERISDSLLEMIAF